MQTNKRVVLSTSALALLFAVVAFGTPHAVEAAGAPTQPLQVVVTNTPLPVEGSVDISTIPALELAPGTSVNVENLVRVHQNDLPAPRQPVHATGPLAGFGAAPPVHYIVPDGCRLVLEQVSGSYTVTGGGPYALAIMSGVYMKDQLEIREDPHTDNYYRFHQLTRLYFDEGESVGVAVANLVSASGTVFLSGYLAPMPGQVCDP